MGAGGGGAGRGGVGAAAVDDPAPEALEDVDADPLDALDVLVSPRREARTS